MTKEEAISIMNVIVHMLEPQYDNDRVEEAVDMAIKSLEQGDVLDKIKVEIGWMNSAAYMGEYNVGLRDALKVIDKYTKEL